MPSDIDNTIPADGVDVAKAPLRLNWTRTRNELNHGGFITHVPDNYIAQDDTTNAHIVGMDAALATAGDVPAIRRIDTGGSIEGGGDFSADRTINLINDESDPGANKVYGTNGSGVKGFKDDPTVENGGGSVEAEHRTFPGNNTLVFDASEVTYPPVTGGREILKGTSTWNASFHLLPYTGDATPLTFGAGFVDTNMTTLTELAIGAGVSTLVTFLYHEQQNVVIVSSALLNGAGSSESVEWDSNDTLAPNSIAFDVSASYHPLTISTNTTFGLASAGHRNGMDVAFRLTISGTPTLTWPSTFVAATDADNASLPTSLPAGTYFVQMKYVANLAGAGVHRVVVALADPGA